MEYNINFKYNTTTTSTGPLGAMGGIRNKALAAAKREGSGIKPDSSTKLVEVNNKLIRSIDKLSQSVSALTSAMAGKGGAGAGNNGGGFTYGKAIAGGMAGGAVGGIVGFTLQKINEIGNAYISKVSEQKGSAGIAGFASGREGMYLATEIGGMRKSHRMASGRFSGGVDPYAAKFGTIFGLGAEEVGRTSGQFARYGDNFQNTAYQAAGAGIETDLPALMTGMAQVLSDAVKEGINSSDLSADLGRELISLTSHTSTKSVEMALSISNKFKGVHSSAAAGKIGGMAELLTYRGGQSAMLEELNSPVKGQQLLQSWQEKGKISGDQMTQLMNLRGNGKLDINSIQNVVGAAGVTYLSGSMIQSMHPVEAQRRSIKEFQKMNGNDDMNAKQSAYAIFGSNSYQPAEWDALWANANNPLTSDLKGKGAKKLNDQYKNYADSQAGMGVAKEGMQQDVLFQYGKSFAETSLAMEKQLLKIAETAAPAAVKGLGLLATGASEVAEVFKKVKTAWEGTAKDRAASLKAEQDSLKTSGFNTIKTQASQYDQK